MYRSQSTSSVFINALHQVNPGEVNPGSNDGDFNGVHYRLPESELYEPEMRSHREPEIRGSTMHTLTSALTGSKMATTGQLPTSAGNRPLPKALQPKAARSPASPPVIGGTVFGRTPPKPSDIRRGSFSHTPTNTLAKPPAPAPGVWAGASRPLSASVSSSSHLRNSSLSSWSSASVKTEADDTSPAHTARGTSSSSGFQSAGHVGRSAVLRRREPVVEDSIYPLLKAALGKDKETENRRTEDEIVRQVFGRSRVFSTGVSPSSNSPARPSTPLMSSPRNIYSSVDDVFASSSSEGMTSPRAGTLPHNHAKSSSEVIASYSSNRMEFLPRRPWRQIPAPMKGGGNGGHGSLRRSTERDEDNRSTEPDYITPSSFSMRPPPLPPNSPPPDSMDAIPGTDHRRLSRVLSCENLCRTPISAEPRKVIRNPWRKDPHPTNSSQPPSVHGKSLPPAESFPLLAMVDRHLLDGDSEFVDAASRSSKIQSTGLVDLDLRRGEKRQTTVPSAMDDSLLPPPLDFRDTTSTTTTGSFPARTTTASSTANGVHFHGRHQATDSVNTEDSGLDRWEKEEEEEEEDGNGSPSADEMDSASDRTTTAAAAAADERVSPSMGGGHWREDHSEGRGSLASSPRPHSADYMSLPSAKEDISYSSTQQLDLIGNESPPGERNIINDRRVPLNGILCQLLAENSTSHRQTPHNNNNNNIYHRSDHHHHHHHRPDDAAEVKRSGGGGETFAPRSVRLPSSDLDSECSNSFSTAVQPSVAESDDTLERISSEAADESLRSTADDFLVFSRKTDLGRDLETVEPWNRRSWFGESGKERTGMKDGAGGDGDVMVVEIEKGPVGVGFCIEGGRGSLSGDRPILVKRLFKGGLADGLVDLRPGDELVSVGGQSLEGFSHYDAWKFIKALPNGTVQMTIRRT